MPVSLAADLSRRDASSLIVARGPMAFLAGNKATVGYLSPLTGLPHYSFVGGQAAAQLVNLGLDAIVLLGGGAARPLPGDIGPGARPGRPVQGRRRAARRANARPFIICWRPSWRAMPGREASLLWARARDMATARPTSPWRASITPGAAARARCWPAWRGRWCLRGDPLEQGQFFAACRRQAFRRRARIRAFARSPNRAISDLLAPHTARLSSRTGGTIAKLYTTGCIEQDGQTLPARNATQIGYEMAMLGDKRVLAATRDGQTGCHWCPVDCRHWHWAPADYAPGGRDRFLDDFEPTYAVLAMLGLLPDDASFKGQLAFLQEVDRRLFVPIEQLGCDVIDVGVGLAALFEGLERGIVPQEDVPAELRGAQLGDLEPAVAAVALLREGVEGEPYPALRAIGDGPQALVGLYPEMADLVFTCGQGTLGNAGHCNALWTFLMPFSRFFGHYSGQIYKIDEALPAPPADDEALRRVFRRVIARMFDREFFGILCNALSCCAFTFVPL